MLSATDFLKKYTRVPNDFIDELYTMYTENTSPYELVINLDLVCKWTKIYKKNLIHTLKQNFKVNKDYTIEKSTNPNKKVSSANNYKKVILTPECFKTLMMRANSKKANDIRAYFIEVEHILLKYRNDLVTGLKLRVEQLENNQKPKYKTKKGLIYVLKASDNKDSVYKIGRTTNLRKRLATYNTTEADDVQVLFAYECEDLKVVEGCVKALLQDKRYRKYKEYYKADLGMIKDFISTCNNIKVKYQSPKTLTQSGGYYIALFEASK